MRLIMLLTAVLTISGCGTSGTDGQSSDALKADNDGLSVVDNTCISGALVDGCEFPKPDGYPYSVSVGENYCGAGTGIEYVAVLINGTPSVCVQYDKIIDVAVGYYQDFGIEYFFKYPPYIGAECTIEVEIAPGQVAKVCF